MRKNEHLPIFGIGPVYVVSILLPTMSALFFRNLSVFASGKVVTLRTPLSMMGVLFMVMAIFIWIQAVIVLKLDEHIKKNHLVTSGVYAWVRNPIYSAFMILCIGILLVIGNAWFFILPFSYWFLLTVLLKHTEEKWLQEIYGNEYIAYCRKVNRCWPWMPK